MEKIRIILKNRELLKLIALFAIIFAINVFAMNAPEQAAALSIMKKQKDESANGQKKKRYFIFEKNTNNGIWVNEDIAKSSKTIKNMIDDLGGEATEISLPCHIDTIKLAFYVLKKKININKLSLDQVINIANLFNFLEVPTDELSIVLIKISEHIKKNSTTIYNTLKELHPDLQRFLMTQPAIDYLKNCIIKQYTNNTRELLSNHLIDIRSVAFCHGSTKFISGSSGSSNNLTLWDISNPYHIKHQQLNGPQQDILSVACNHKGTKFASGSAQNQNNLVLWDITDLNDIKHRVLNGHPSDVNSIAFSLDGTKIASCCTGGQNNLILWDISDPNNITHQVLVGHQDTVYSVAFNSNSTELVSGGTGNQNNLILWDISDPNNITHQALIGHPDDVYSVAFSPDSTTIASGHDDEKNNLVLWDIRNQNNITHQTLFGHPKSVQTVAFSPDGRKIVSGCWGDKNNLILWNISNPDNITHQLLISPHSAVLSVAFSPNGKKMISGGHGTTDQLFLWTLLTDLQALLLNNLQNYTIDHIRLIYQLCLQSGQGKTITLKQDSEEQKVFATLPQEMQDLLNDLLISHNSFWFYKLWDALIEGRM